MGLRKWLGLPEDDEEPKIAVGLANVTMPLDLALELVFRQQSQIFAELARQSTQDAVNEAVAVAQGERLTHLHDDIVSVRQALEAATKHPVDRKGLDEPQEEKKLLN